MSAWTCDFFLPVGIIAYAKTLKESIGTATPQGRFMLTVFGALAELEREGILERQREGIEIAKNEGKYKGRKPIDYDEALFKQFANVGGREKPRQPPQ